MIQVKRSCNSSFCESSCPGFGQIFLIDSRIDSLWGNGMVTGQSNQFSNETFQNIQILGLIDELYGRSPEWNCYRGLPFVAKMSLNLW